MPKAEIYYRSERQVVTVYQIWMYNSFQIIELKNKLCHYWFEKVTYSELKSELTSHRTFFDNGKPMGRKKFKVLEVGGRVWRDDLVRNVDPIGLSFYFCLDFPLCELQCELLASLFMVRLLAWVVTPCRLIRRCLYFGHSTFQPWKPQILQV
jgi:hypothetical protein